MARKRKLTVETDGQFEDEQAIKIVDELYDIFYGEIVNWACNLRGVKVEIDIRKERKPPDTLVVQKVMWFHLFYYYPFIKGSELKVSVKWDNSKDIRRLEVREATVLGKDTFGEDFVVFITLPLQPCQVTTFEELFARALIKAIEVCITAANRKYLSDNQLPFLKAAVQNQGFTASSLPLL